MSIDLYENRFIAYSLGNFATYGRFNLSGPNGIAPIIELTLEPDGTFISGQIHSIKQPGNGGPVLDDKNKVISVIQELNESDLPGCPLEINNIGEISVKSKF